MPTVLYSNTLRITWALVHISGEVLSTYVCGSVCMAGCGYCKTVALIDRSVSVEISLCGRGLLLREGVCLDRWDYVRVCVCVYVQYQSKVFSLLLLFSTW